MLFRSTKGFEALPKNAQAYLRWVEKEIGAKLAFVSVGRGREDTIDLRKTAKPAAPRASPKGTRSRKSRR